MMRQLQGGGGAQAAPGADIPTVDNAETVYISSLALLKVGWAGACGRVSLWCGGLTRVMDGFPPDLGRCSSMEGQESHSR